MTRAIASDALYIVFDYVFMVSIDIHFIPFFLGKDIDFPNYSPWINSKGYA